MKTGIGVILGIIAGIAILVGGGIWASNFIGSTFSQKPVLVPAPTPAGTPVPNPPPAPSSTPSPSPTLPSPSPSPTLPVPVPSPTLKAGIWEFSIAGVSGSGLTQTIAAQITNTGTTDANNTQAKIEVFSQQQRIKLSGQDYLTENLGTVKAKTTVTRQVTVSLSLTDGLKILQNGARFVLTITSDKGTDTLNYDYKP